MASGLRDKLLSSKLYATGYEAVSNYCQCEIQCNNLSLDAVFSSEFILWG